VINRELILVVLVLASSTASAAILDCAMLKASVESKLKANKVRQYSLDIVAADQKVNEATGRVVGTCNNSRQKLVYAILAKAVGGVKPSAQAVLASLPVSSVDARSH